MPERIKQYLSSSFAAWFCFLLALLIKVGFIRSFLEIGNDLLLTVVTTNHWLQGHGISVNASSASDLASPTYIPYTGWPPGIHLHLAPFLSIFGEHSVSAIFFLMAVVSIFFLWILRVLLLFIGFPAWLANLFLIFQSFTLGRALLTSSPSEYVGLMYLLGGIYFTCKLLTAQNPVKWNLLAILFLTVAGLTRYLYVPVSISIGIAVLAFGLVNRNRNWIRSGIYISTICSALLLLINIIFVSQGSVDFYLAPIKRGIYPENILQVYPFMLSPFLNVELYSIQVSKILQLPYQVVLQLFRALTFLLLLVFIIHAARYLIRWKLNPYNNWSSFMTLGSFTSLVIIAILFFLSLVLGTQLEPLLGNWTFVMEARYFAFPILFIQVLAWKLLFVDAAGRRSIFGRALSILLIALVSAWVVHGSYVLVKKMRSVTPLEQLPFKEEEILFVYNTIRNHRESNKSTELVFTSVNKLVCYTANWYGQPAVYDPLTLNNSRPRASKETELIVGIKKQHKKFLNQFLSRKDAILIYTSSQFEFYKVQIAATRKE